MANFQTQFIDKIQIAKHAWIFRFHRPKGLIFLPGQYLNWTIGNASRSFTLSLSPQDTDVIAFTTEEGISLYKKALFVLKKGETISVQGPMGGFYFRDTDSKPQVLLSEGIGITPFYTMITHGAEKKLKIPVLLLASFESFEDVIFYEELMRVVNKTNNIKIIYSLIHPKKSWNSETGDISEILIEKYVHNISSVLFSLVGSPEWVSKKEDMLRKMGVALESIKLELFDGY